MEADAECGRAGDDDAGLLLVCEPDELMNWSSMSCAGSAAAARRLCDCRPSSFCSARFIIPPPPLVGRDELLC